MSHGGATVAGKPGGRVLVHAVGGGDLGLAGVPLDAMVAPDYEGDADATGKDRRPLRKIFEGLAETGTPVSAVVLLGTTTPSRPGTRPLADRAEEIRAHLVSADGLCGGRFDPQSVVVVPVVGPYFQGASRALGSWLAERRPAEVLVSCGSGAFALSVGALCATLVAQVPARILHIDAAGEPYALERPGDVDGHLRLWLIRHRFWDILVEADSKHQDLWRLLAARQAGDLRAASEALKYGTTELPAGRLDKFADPWETTKAALFERLGRGEAADHGILRAWFADQLRRWFEEEKDLDSRTREAIQRLLGVFRTRGEGEGNISGHIRITSQVVQGHARCVRMLKDQALIDLYTAAATHAAHLEPHSRASRPLPVTLLDAAEEWERGDQGVKLVGATGTTMWPVLGSGDVLGLMAVGLDREGRDSDDLLAIQAVVTCLRHRQDVLQRHGVPRLCLLASPETAERAHRLARLSPTDADVRVIEGVQGDMGAVRDTVLAALAAGDAATGRTGSGSLRDVDEIVLVLNPGPPLTNYGMIAAAAHWSLTAACPLWVTGLIRTADGAPATSDGQRVLARLGADRMLTSLAMGATHRLDLRTAQRLAERGSDLLLRVLPKLRALERNLFGKPPGPASRASLLGLARQRLTLIAHACGRQPLPAAYLAVESLRPALFPWSVFKTVCEAVPSLRELAQAANHTLHGHALDKRARRGHGRIQPCTADPEALLREAVRGLGGPTRTDHVLIEQHQSAIDALDGVYRESG
ncbi:hypothetical protein C1I98_31410 [Spongiactinospora gelatinilytica]|uniref:Uncharacterized protein n=1 Tax=Spongiactinospora gelatinilytica TaxID=2666298 RepID=A0A2W2FY39_9ACTN|nr:hypothetical protein [Spongiactinospora gelatinilytica]PZG30110.1 hypothetical protein C1I98_31410 [Spongiactinospora gelatinilytica]